MSEKLHRTLKHLHTELQSGAPLDEAARQELQAVLAEIQGALDQQAPHPETTRERLLKSAVAFELSHPKLADLTRVVSEALREAGI